MPLDVTHLVLARQDVQELLLYGGDKAVLDNSKVESVETTEQRKGKTTLRTMLVELLMFFAKTYRWVVPQPRPPPVQNRRSRGSLFLSPSPFPSLPCRENEAHH